MKSEKFGICKYLHNKIELNVKSWHSTCICTIFISRISTVRCTSNFLRNVPSEGFRSNFFPIILKYQRSDCKNHTFRIKSQRTRAINPTSRPFRQSNFSYEKIRDEWHFGAGGKLLQLLRLHVMVLYHFPVVWTFSQWEINNKRSAMCIRVYPTRIYYTSEYPKGIPIEIYLFRYVHSCKYC